MFLFWIIPLQLFTIIEHQIHWCRSQFLMIFFLFFFSFFFFSFFSSTLALFFTFFLYFFSNVTDLFVFSFYFSLLLFFIFFGGVGRRGAPLRCGALGLSLLSLLGNPPQWWPHVFVILLQWSSWISGCGWPRVSLESDSGWWSRRWNAGSASLWSRRKEKHTHRRKRPRNGWQQMTKSLL